MTLCGRLAPERAKRPSEQRQRRARAGRREAAQGFEQREHIVVVDRLEKAEQPKGRLVRDAPEQSKASFERPCVDLWHQADRAVEQSNEHEERREPVAELDELLIV